jgi:hypothetical protein
VRRLRSHTSLAWLCFVLLLLAPLLQTTAGEKDNIEYKVKAAYLYNFTKFITWPEQAFDFLPETALSICILGDDPFGHSIDLLTNKTARGREVVVVYLQQFDEQSVCHVVFVSRSEAGRVQEIFAAIGDRPVLTVSDIEGFAMKGGCIRLHIVDGKVRFNINIQAARRAHLQMSAKLLELARVVIE